MVMVYPRCKTAREVEQTIERLSHRTELVSFDMFDTLVRRRIMPPERAKIPAARALSRILSDRRVDYSTDEVLGKRFEVEDRLKRKAVAAGYDNDYHIEEMIEIWLGEYLEAPEAKELAPRILAEELAHESRSCYAEPGMIEAVRKARELGKRIIWISEMFLDRKHISQLLDQCGYETLFDEGYASSQLGLRKHSGRLYEAVLQREGIVPARWLHFGDSLRDDLWIPRRLGGTSFLYLPERHFKKRSRLRRLKRLGRVHPQWIGAQLAECLYADVPAYKANDVAYVTGRHILGPALANFIHRVLEYSSQHNIEMVLFPARDGFVLKSIFDRMRPVVFPHSTMTSQYCFLTRKSVYAASVSRIGMREIQACFARARIPTLRNILSRFTDEPEAFEAIAKQCGFESLDRSVTDPHNDYSFQRFVAQPQVTAILRSNQSASQAILTQYLDQLGFWGDKRIALVDVGWRATVQDALTTAFADREGWPTLHGLYFGLVPHFPVMQTPKSLYRGLMYEFPGSRSAYCPCERFPHLMELSTRAYHATTVAFDTDQPSGEIVPVFKSETAVGRRLEVRDQGVQSSIQAGIFDAMDAYSELVPYQELPPESYSPFFLAQLERLFHLPRKEEARVFSTIFNAEDFGTIDSTELLDNARRVRPSRSWLKAFRASGTWHEGIFAGTGIPGILTLFNLYRIMTTRHY